MRVKAPTARQKERWQRARELGCMICRSPAAIHHCFTGKGGRKDHDAILPLCHYHHQGEEGIHTIGRRKWQTRYGYEGMLMEVLAKQLGEL